MVSKLKYDMMETYILDRLNNILATENVKDNIVGVNYFDFSYDEVLVNMLKNIFDKVRINEKTFSTTYRCDNDDYVRYFKLNIIPMKNQMIKLEHILTKQTKRKTSLKNFGRSSKTYKMCAWCNKVLYNGKYIKIEHAINELNIFDDEGIPSFTHGICESCISKIDRELTSYEL
jgi:hypothetical protein